MVKNVGSNWFLMAVTGLVTLVLMPFNLGHLGVAQYGLWLVIAAMVAYLYLFHLGVPMASVREMTQAIATGDTRKLNQVVSSCAVLYLAMGLLVGLLGVPLLVYFEHTYLVPDDLRSAARLAFVLALVQTGLGFIAFQPYAVIQAYQSFVPKNVLLTLAVLVRFAVNLPLVALYPSLSTLAIVNLSVTVFELVASWSYVLWTYPAIRPALRHVRLATLRSIISFSIYVFLMALGGQLAFQTSALVIGHLMTPSDVVTFAVPNSLMLILMQFLGGIASVIMPLSTNLQTRGDTAALREILYKWTKISLALSWCAGLFLLVFGPAFLVFWIKGAYTPAAGEALQILMLSYLVYLPVRAVAVPMLMGLGRAKWPTIATLAAGALNLILSFIWVREYGILGAAWGTFVPNLLLSLVLAILVCRELAVPVSAYLKATLPLATGGGIVGLCLLGWWHLFWQPTGLLGLGVAGVATVAVCALIWMLAVLRNDPHLDPLPLLGPFGKRLPWARS